MTIIGCRDYQMRNEWLKEERNGFIDETLPLEEEDIITHTHTNPAKQKNDLRRHALFQW